ncbi:MAG: PH domain-containing protein, partial [Muribaculaceae bacterium]|nr:PH domain-containing protein [Muribaculaceae bacterium]
MTDFSRPQKMSPGAFFIIWVKSFIDILKPVDVVALYKIFNLQSEKYNAWQIILIGLLITFVAALIIAAFSYFTKKFYIKGGNLVFIHGIFNRETTSVPLDKIHSLRTKKGIWYRLLDMRGIVFDTLASRDAEIELILDEFDWKRLLKVIEKEEKPQPVSSTDPPEYNPTQTVRFPTKDLLLAALCQNHLKGMAVLGSFFALIFNNLSELSEETTDNLANFLDSYTETLIYSPLK